MANGNIDKIKKSFSVQAGSFEGNNMSFSKKEYLDYTINSIDANEKDCVLEVASGTCLCGRAIASFVSSVVCIDATAEMLAVGKREAEKQNIKNIKFLEGFAEKLPFDDESFDIVITRLSFHHFTDVEKVFEEMNRVVKKGGKLVIIDMEASEERLRKKEDEIETLRDFSHVKNLSKDEFLALYNNYKYQIVKAESTPIPVNLKAWLELTNTPDDICQKINELMRNDIAQKEKTGFYPYEKDGEIYFNQRWIFFVGIKAEN